MSSEHTELNLAAVAIVRANLDGSDLAALEATALEVSFNADPMLLLTSVAHVAGTALKPRGGHDERGDRHADDSRSAPRHDRGRAQEDGRVMMIHRRDSRSLARCVVATARWRTGRPLTCTFSGRAGGARTHDPRIMSPLL